MGVARLYYRLVKFEHTIFALPFAYVGAFLAVDGRAVRARPALDHRRDGRRPLARDGAQPPDRRAHRRGEPAHGGARAPVGRADAGGGGRVLRGVARRLPRRRLAARPARPLALAGAGDRVRRLPVPEAVHVALPPLARRGRRARARSAPGRRSRASCRGRRGRSARPSPPGSPASTSSTRSSTSTSTASRGCTRGRRASASAARSPARASCTWSRSCCWSPSGSALTVGWLYWVGVLIVGGAAPLRAHARAARATCAGSTRRSSR